MLHILVDKLQYTKIMAFISYCKFFSKNFKFSSIQNLQSNNS